ncbi:MAG: acyl-CoA dehydrogenase family protein [Chthoniobacterales bacterium]
MTTKPPVSDEVESAIDTSKMSEGERAALEMTESARDAAVSEKTFAGGLFFGRYDLPQIDPYPEQSFEDRDQGDAFLKKLKTFLEENVDPDSIDENGEIPQKVLDGLAEMGAFGIKVPVQYGGMGLSQTNYCRAAILLGSFCGNLTALLSAHQSIGVPQPLLLFGTETQKRKYLPRVSSGEISAFALTESGVGSDPARMQTHAEPTGDKGDTFILNGQKIWCTNGTRAGVIVVMAKTPSKIVNGRSKDQITAFIVETSWPGVEIVQRCRFMGLKALYNAVINFHDVRVPRENIILAEGKGLKVALTTLNTGRLTLPAACIGLAKRCLEISTRWSKERIQWGKPIGEHGAIADKIANMAADTFAMEAMTMLTTSFVDKGKADLRLESAMCKLWGTEAGWRMANDTMQIRGGRGYETATSLRSRGEAPDAVERMVRDCRINTIFEGSSEIMKLFIAREALDPHLKIGAPVLNTRLPISLRLKAMVNSTIFYGHWYPSMWLPRISLPAGNYNPVLRKHIRWCASTTRRLARRLFHKMLRFGPSLEKRQMLLGRFVEIGTELFAMSAACSRAQALLNRKDVDADSAIKLADYFCCSAQLRIEQRFDALQRNTDSDGCKIAKDVMTQLPSILKEGIF